MGRRSIERNFYKPHLVWETFIFLLLLYSKVDLACAQEQIFDPAKQTEIVLVLDDSPGEFQKNKALAQEFLKDLSEDRNFKEKLTVKLIPYSFQYQRPQSSLDLLQGGSLSQMKQKLSGMFSRQKNLKLYDGLRSLETLLKWEKVENSGLFKSQQNSMILFIGKTEFGIKARLDPDTGTIKYYQQDPYEVGILSSIHQLLARSPNANNFSLIFGESNPGALIPFNSLSLLSASAKKEDGFPDLSSNPRVVLGNFKDLSHMMDELKGLMWDKDYFSNRIQEANKRWQAIQAEKEKEKQKLQRMADEHERDQMEESVQNRFRPSNVSKSPEPQDLSYQDQTYLAKTDLPIKLLPLSRFDFLYRFYSANSKKPLRMEIRRQHYLLDYTLISQINRLDPSLLKRITGENLHQVSRRLEETRAQANTEFLKKLFQSLGDVQFESKVLKGTDTFTHILSFPTGVTEAQVENLLRQYVASPKSSETGHGLFDQQQMIEALLHRPFNPKDYISRNGDISQISTARWQKLLGIPKTRIHPADMNMLYGVEKVRTGFLGLGSSYQELQLFYSEPVLDDIVFDGVLKRDPGWLSRRTDYSRAEIEREFEIERMIGSTDSPGDGELDYFTKLFEGKGLKVLGTQIVPDQSELKLRFSVNTPPEKILAVMHGQAKKLGLRDVSNLLRLVAGYVQKRKLQEELEKKQSDVLKPADRVQLENQLHDAKEKTQELLNLVKTDFSECNQSLDQN